MSAAVLPLVPYLPATVDVEKVPQGAKTVPSPSGLAAEVVGDDKPVSDTLALRWRRWWRRIIGERD